jgi:hypothetical protein
MTRPRGGFELGSYAHLQAQTLTAKAEVNRLTGARNQAEASLRAALHIYQDRHATPPADRATAASPPSPATPASGPRKRAPATPRNGRSARDHAPH